MAGKCPQVQKSWSKSPPLYGETESGMVAQLNKLSGLWWRQQSQDKSPWLRVCPQDSVKVKYKISNISAREVLCPLGKVSFKKVRLVSRLGGLPYRQGNEISLIPLYDFNILLCYFFVVFYLLWWAETTQSCDSYRLKWDIVIPQKWEEATVLIFISWGRSFLTIDELWTKIN